MKTVMNREIKRDPVGLWRWRINNQRGKAVAFSCGGFADIRDLADSLCYEVYCGRDVTVTEHEVIVETEGGMHVFEIVR